MILTTVTLGASLVSAIARADGIAECARESGESADAFVRRSFDTRSVKLYDGTRVSVAVSKSNCLAHNSVNRVLAFAQTSGAYRLVLDDYGFSYNVDALADGTVTLSSHETVDIIDEATYVWNGKKYVLSPERSYRYDVAIGQGRAVGRSEQERPYVVRVRFAPGTSSAVLKGSIAAGFGDSYEFDARAGQHVTVQVLKGWSKNFSLDVSRGSPGNSATTDLTPLLNTARTWSGVIPATGTWKLDVSGASAMDNSTTSPYTLVLTIH